MSDELTTNTAMREVETVADVFHTAVLTVRSSTAVQWNPDKSHGSGVGEFVPRIESPAYPADLWSNSPNLVLTNVEKLSRLPRFPAYPGAAYRGSTVLLTALYSTRTTWSA